MHKILPMTPVAATAATRHAARFDSETTLAAPAPAAADTLPHLLPLSRSLSLASWLPLPDMLLPTFTPSTPPAHPPGPLSLPPTSSPSGATSCPKEDVVSSRIIEGDSDSSRLSCASRNALSRARLQTDKQAGRQAGRQTDRDRERDRKRA